jgi:hypothetical protein
MQSDIFTVNSLFEVKSGDYHDTITLSAGTVPLISCGDEQQGLVGYFDIPEENVFRNCLTVAYNGLPLTTKYHPYRFAAKDDVAVLEPRNDLGTNTLLYIAATLNSMKWRYNYGRKCFKAKLRNVKLRLPSKGKRVGTGFINTHFPVDIRSLIPDPQHARGKSIEITNWRVVHLAKLFDLERGHFHSIKDLDEGKYRTVSRLTTMNGTAGYFDIPDGARVFPAKSITVSTVGGDAFVQLDEFIATDNVIVLTPKSKLETTTLFFIVFILNNQKWRYSYGRQCYKKKLEMTKIFLPHRNQILDETAMKSWVNTQKYWNVVQNKLA